MRRSASLTANAVDDNLTPSPAPRWGGRRRQVDGLGQAGEVVGAMGKRHGGDEMLLESRGDGGFDFFDPPYGGLNRRAGMAIEQGHDGTGTGGVAGRAPLNKRAPA